MSRKRIYLLASLLGALPAALWMFEGILSSTSSTAAVGFLFLPVAAGAGAIAGAFLAFSAFTLRDLSRRRREGMVWRLPLVLLVALVAALWSWRWQLEGEWLATAQAEGTSASVLGRIHASRAWVRRDAIAEALAGNRNTPPAVLGAIAAGAGPRLLWRVGENPGTPAAWVERIAAGPLHYSSLGGVARNPLLSRAAMERLASAGPEDFGADVEWRLYQTYVLAGLLRREGFPLDLYERIARIPEPEHFLVIALIESPHASCELLQRFTAEGNPVLRNMVDGQLATRGCPRGTP